jgi:hypothetical protein
MFKRSAKVILPVVVLAVIAAITIGASGPCSMLSLLTSLLG